MFCEYLLVEIMCHFFLLSQQNCKFWIMTFYSNLALCCVEPMQFLPLVLEICKQG